MPTIRLPHDTTFEDLLQFKRSVNGHTFTPSQFRQKLYAFLRVRRADRKKARKAFEKELLTRIQEMPDLSEPSSHLPFTLRRQQR